MLRRFLPSVIEHSPEAEVIVADNGSTDDSLQLLAERFPDIRTIVFDRNYGFAEGYNKAIAEVNSDLCLLLNSDVRVEAGWLKPMLDYMEAHPEVVACQPKIRCEWEPDKLEYAGACGGYIDRLGFPFCRGRILGTVYTNCFDSLLNTDRFLFTVVEVYSYLSHGNILGVFGYRKRR